VTTLEKLKAAGVRIDGLSWNGAGELVFVATPVSGPWTQEQKAQACAVLGRREAPTKVP